MNRLRTALLACCLVAVPALGSAATKPKAPLLAPGPACDRECLHGMVSTVPFAFLKHDTSGLPVADKLRVTEDSVEKPLDQVGLTRSLTRLRGYRQDIIDERAGIAGAHVMIEEAGAPTLLVVRLKVVGDEISELETVATHSKAEGQIFNIDGLDHPSEGMGKVPRLDQLPTREEAIHIALLYRAGLETSSFVKADTYGKMPDWSGLWSRDLSRGIQFDTKQSGNGFNVPLGPITAETLVVHSIRTVHGEYQRSQPDYSSQTSTLERIHMVDRDTIVDEVTVWDPKGLRTPWHVLMQYQRVTDTGARIDMWSCESNNNVIRTASGSSQFILPGESVTVTRTYKDPDTFYLTTTQKKLFAQDEAEDLAKQGGKK